MSVAFVKLAAAALIGLNEPPPIVLDLNKLYEGKNLSAEERLALDACEARPGAVRDGLEKGARFDATFEFGDTKGAALFLAAACYGGSDDDRLQIVDDLLAAGAAADAAGAITFESIAMPMRAASAAAYNRRHRVLARLLEKGADPEAADELRGGSPLLWAAESRCLACVDALAAHGAEVDRRNVNALTPLYVAAVRGDDDMVAKLLAAGASPFVEDAAGVDVLTVAGSDAVRARLASARRRTYATAGAWAAAGLFLAVLGVVVLRRQRAATEAS